MKHSKKLVYLGVLLLTHAAQADHYCENLKVFNDADADVAVAVLKSGPHTKVFSGKFEEVSSGGPFKGGTITSYNLIAADKSAASLKVTAFYNCNRVTCNPEMPFQKVAKLNFHGNTYEFNCPTLKN